MTSRDPAVSKRLFTNAAKTAGALWFILGSAAGHGTKHGRFFRGTAEHRLRTGADHGGDVAILIKHAEK